MTFVEFLKALRVRLILVIIITLLGLYVGNSMGARIVPSYQATATIFTNASLSISKGFATDAANAVTDKDVTASVSMSSSDATVTINVSGGNSQKCIDTANSIANAAKQQINDKYPQQFANVTEAKTARNTARNPKYYTWGATAIGLALGIVIVIIWDLCARRIHDWQTVERSANLPYLGSLGGNATRKEKLSATVHIASHEADTDTVCLVPVGKTKCAPFVSQQLDKTIADHASDKEDIYSPLTFLVASTRDKSANTFLDKTSMRCPVLVVEEERSTYKDLDAALRELAIADAKPAGFIYVGTWTSKRVRWMGQNAVQPVVIEEEPKKTVNSDSTNADSE